MNKKLPTIILRIITILTAVAGILVCIFVLPGFGTAIAKNFPEYAFWQYPILIGVYAAAVCFFFALFQFWLLMSNIDRADALSINNLKAIRISTIVFSILYFLFAMPIIFLAAEADDAPGLILAGAFLDLFPIGIAAFAAVLERICKRDI